MTNLEHSHRPLEIRRRLAAEHRPSYLPVAILGGIDGCVTTIAVVASVAGAGLPGVVAFVLGSAGMVADGFSMAVSNYQAEERRRCARSAASPGRTTYRSDAGGRARRDPLLAGLGSD